MNSLVFTKHLNAHGVHFYELDQSYKHYIFKDANDNLISLPRFGDSVKKELVVTACKVFKIPEPFVMKS